MSWGTLAPSGGLVATAQGHTTPCEQGGPVSQKRPSLPPAGAQRSPGTTTQRTLPRQVFGPVPLQHLGSVHSHLGTSEGSSTHGGLWTPQTLGLVHPWDPDPAGLGRPQEGAS